jgi:hypothetical protein
MLPFISDSETKSKNRLFAESMKKYESQDSKNDTTDRFLLKKVKIKH